MADETEYHHYTDQESLQPVNASEDLQTDSTEVITAATKPVYIEFEEPAKPLKRITKSTSFTSEEFNHVDRIVKARQDAGLTMDYSHFLRQCVDFAINTQHQKGLVFATPDLPILYLNNAFFKPAK